jgi:hypothetical protein
VIFQCLLLVSKPYHPKSDNYVSLYIEVSLSIFVYILLLFIVGFEESAASTKTIVFLSTMLSLLLILAIFVCLVNFLVKFSIKVFVYLRIVR